MYRNIILPAVLCGYETWSLKLREKHRLRLFENRVLMRIFGPRRDKVTRDMRKLHNEELKDLLLTKYYSGVNIERNVMGGACSNME